jgi:hypothetical protein
MSLEIEKNIDIYSDMFTAFNGTVGETANWEKNYKILTFKFLATMALFSTV